MKLSDVSVGQLDEQEQERLNGLGYSRAEGSTLKSQSNAITKPLAQAQQAVLDEQKKQAAALIAAQQTALAKKTDAQPAQGPTAPAPSYGSGYDWAALFKNPWYWAGVAAVVGVAFLYMRSRRSVKAVSAVETLALEGMDEEKPKRKRRRRRKAKKTEE